MKNCMYIHKRKLFIACLCLCAILIAFFAAPKSASAPVLMTAGDSGTLIQAYLEFLKNPREGQSVLYCESAGMWTEGSENDSMPLEEAEMLGLLNSTYDKDLSPIIERRTEIAEQQNKLVIEQFGPEAWENVTYTVEETDAVDGKLGYKDLRTGDYISEDAYNRMLRDYWEGIAEKENVSYYDIFLRDDEPSEKISEKRIDLINEYAEDVPVALAIVSDAKTYNVNLAFFDKTESEGGYNDFHFVINNRTGAWTVFSGLSWTGPNPELPSGD